VPKLWTQTVESHRREVRDAILDATATLVSEGGLLSVTMSGIAERTGIGRATLYKYFPDVEAILVAWHERLISAHLEDLTELRERAGSARDRLAVVLEAYALMLHESRGHDRELTVFVHRDMHVARARVALQELIRALIAEGADRGDVRNDISPDELASYCLHALGGAATRDSKAAVRRLVVVTLTGLRPSAAS
jgi:AcrR family transcriptional regulator